MILHEARIRFSGMFHLLFSFCSFLPKLVFPTISTAPFGLPTCHSISKPDCTQGVFHTCCEHADPPDPLPDLPSHQLHGKSGGSACSCSAGVPEHLWLELLTISKDSLLMFRSTMAAFNTELFLVNSLLRTVLRIYDWPGCLLDSRLTKIMRLPLSCIS